MDQSNVWEIWEGLLVSSPKDALCLLQEKTKGKFKTKVRRRRDHERVRSKKNNWGRGDKAG